MEREQIQAAITKAKDSSEKRKFNQSYDLVMTLKGLDLKKPEHQVDTFVTLPHSRGKKVRVCALVGAELFDQAKNSCDFAVLSDEFNKYKDKKDVKKLANSYDFFIAQANVMTKVASVFGRVFGPRGKMPNPKSGCVVPPNANLKVLYDKLQKTVRVNAKSAPMIQCPIGTEDMRMDDVAENGLTVINSVLHLLPNEKHNIKELYIKLTMGKPAKVGEKIEVSKETR